jgi:hypothetical protein
MEWGEVLFSIIPAAMALLAALRMRGSRVAAYRMLERATLVLIFITQLFAYYFSLALATLGLLANILILAALRYALHRETRFATPPVE